MRRDQMLTVAQVAAYLQLHRTTVYGFIRDGRLVASRLGRSYRVRRPDLDAFLEIAQSGRRGGRRRDTVILVPPRAETAAVLRHPVQGRDDAVARHLVDLELRLPH